MDRLRVNPLTLSSSRVMRKKTAKKNGRVKSSGFGIVYIVLLFFLLLATLTVLVPLSFNATAR